MAFANERSLTGGGAAGVRTYAMRLAALVSAVTTAGFIFACSNESAAPAVGGSAGAHSGNGSLAGDGATGDGAAGSASGAGSRGGAPGTSAAGMASGGAAIGGSATGGSGSGGISGSSGGASAGGAAGASGSGLPPFGPAPTDKPDTVEIGVRNNCPFPIWIHGQGAQGTLMPDYQQLQKGEHYWYDAPKQWEAARVTAYGDATHQQELDKVEMTLVANGDVLNYNVTYVDWVGLPVEMLSRGTGADCKKVACYVPQQQILTGCPDGLLDGKRCLAARSYCLDPAHDGEAYCHVLDSEVQRCAQTQPDCQGAAGDDTSNVYACDGFFAQHPKWCAALNRHMLTDPDNKDTSKYYQSAPYNTYSKWVHQVCPGIYAFAYDDYPPSAEESGFHACTGGKELEITFCPGG